MSVELNHTIVWCRDKRASSRFLAELLGLPEPREWGPFSIVEPANGVSLDFHDQVGWFLSLEDAADVETLLTIGFS